MRLINVHTLKFEEFLESNIPPYCILSHRWGDDEVTYKEFRKGLRKDSAGYRKVVDFCEFVKRRTFFDFSSWTYPDERGRVEVEWVWVDTCCIDKKSSAELSEAINSMFKWYEYSVECVAYLADVSDTKPASLARSSWFTRGWTLQELLAPMQLVVCNKDWKVLGHKCATYSTIDDDDCELHQAPWLGPCLLDVLSRLTTVQKGLLASYIYGLKHPFRNASVAQKMSWAARRKTSRIEDQAYCLLGIFSVNMPLIYGEGGKAFQRLQMEILNTCTDPSIFTFTPSKDSLHLHVHGILAASPAAFISCGRTCDRVLTPRSEMPKVVKFGPEGLEMEATTLAVDKCRKVRNLKCDIPETEHPPDRLLLVRLSCWDRGINGNADSAIEMAFLLERSACGSYYRNLGVVTTKLFHQAPPRIVKRQQILISTKSWQYWR